MGDGLPPRLEVRYWCCVVCGRRVQTLSEADWRGYVDCGGRGCKGAMIQLPGKPSGWTVERPAE